MQRHMAVRAVVRGRWERVSGEPAPPGIAQINNVAQHGFAANGRADGRVLPSAGRPGVWVAWELRYWKTLLAGRQQDCLPHSWPEQANGLRYGKLVLE
jgi:hypothetical protein